MDRLATAFAIAPATRPLDTAREALRDVAPRGAAGAAAGAEVPHPPGAADAQPGAAPDGDGHSAEVRSIEARLTDARPQRWSRLAPFAPDPAHLERNRIVTYRGGRIAGPFDALRTRMVQEMRARGWTRVAVTSPTAGCGKSTVAANLALSLGRQADLRTVVLDLDLRRPSLARLLGLAEPMDFAAVLAGRAGFADQARRLRDNLALGLAAGPARQPSELLQSLAAAGALSMIETDLAPQVMLFDLPPMLEADDVIAVAPQVDAVLLVAAAGTTTLRQIDDCERELARQTNVLGVVLNKCRQAGRGSA